jgi:hypothetical protein
MTLLDTSFTRVDFWKEPLYTKRGLLILTALVGFFGFHHLYLHSPQSAVACFLVNCLTLGWWWAYDITQLYNRSEEDLNTYGLDSPFGALGLAQGMFTSAEALKQRAEQKSVSSGPPAPPNPLFTVLYYILLPISSVFAAGIAGDAPNAVSRLFFFLPFFWFIGMAAWLFDLYRAFVTPKTLFERGHSRFLPFTWLGFDLENHSPNIQNEQKPNPCPPKGYIESISDLVKNLLRLFIPIIMIISPQAAQAFDKATQLGEQAIQTGQRAVRVGQAAAQTVAAVPQAAAAMTTALSPATLVQQAKEQATRSAEQALPSIPLPPQKGGGHPSQSPLTQESSSDWLSFGVLGILLVILGGAGILTTARTLSDEPPSRLQNDSPPNPRTV